MRAIAQRIAACADLSNLLDEALAALADCLHIRYAMILIADPRAGKLYWRSWAAGPIEVGAQHDPEKIDRLVDKVLADVPRAKS